MNINTCQNCKGEFVIDQDDFDFYAKINVPPPTFCPECRMKRRMNWRNVRSLYKRTCGLCQKNLISMYPDDGAPVYCIECWNSDKWNRYEHKMQYDFSENFFAQLNKLFKKNPRPYKYAFGNLINSEYANYIKDNKNVYLSYSIVVGEDILYSESLDKSKNSIDCYAAESIDGCSYNVDCEGNYNTHYAVKSEKCIDSYFIYDCVNCKNCCLSSNLRNQSYVFKNQKLEKEEYEKAVLELKLETYSGFENTKKIFDSMLVTDTIHKYAYVYSVENATGDYIHNVKNGKYIFNATESENVAYSMRILQNVKDSYDLQGVGANVELVYDSVAATQDTYKDFFCYITIQGSRECEYSIHLRNCANCFGCVGLVNAQYCILNMQYTEEDYFVLVEKIKKHMNETPYVDKKGRVYRYGEFFPYEMSPFGYNETNAFDFFPITEEEALEKGYNWTKKDKREYEVTIDSTNLPESIHDVKEEIVKEIISCPSGGDQRYQCTSAYQIRPEELAFYRSKKLPLPRSCPNCRHYKRLKYRNQPRLYKRECSNRCGKIFETTYTPDRPEKVYCEDCYQKEVL